MLVRLLTLLVLAQLAIAEQTDANSTFRVVWNVPSFECRSFNVSIDPAPYGFTVNTNQTFLGDQIALIYSPGLFPQILANGSRVNGGLPQLGRLYVHLARFTENVRHAVPDANFSGLAVIDFESWTPWFAEAPAEYREASLALVREQHPGWGEPRVKEQAREDWEWWARLFLQRTLAAAEAERPAAVWGYYQYPLCKNLQVANGTCPEAVREGNDQLSWLLGGSRALYPSIYLFRNGFSDADRRAMVFGRMDETLRQAAGQPAFAYTWFQYHDDSSYLTDADLQLMLGEPLRRGLAGAVVWGATSNCNTAAQCHRLQQYLQEHLGPAVRRLLGLAAEARDTGRPPLGAAGPPPGRHPPPPAVRGRYETDGAHSADTAEPLPWLADEVNLIDVDGGEVDAEGGEAADPSDGGRETAGDPQGAEYSSQQLHKIRQWQDTLGRRLWEMKITRDRALIDGEPGKPTAE